MAKIVRAALAAMNVRLIDRAYRWYRYHHL
jgi:hypothetical protein